ncbi:MAG: hypothetical protein ACYC61_09765, partial [Isosphaeraceae bacterium]
MMSRARAAFALVAVFASASVRRPSRRLILRAASALVALELAILAAWWVYDGWRRGQVELVNGGPPLTVEVLDESGTSLIGDPIELITRTTLRLPDGDYRVRLSGMGRLSQTYRLAVNRGESARYEVSLDGGRLLGDDPDEPIRRIAMDPPVPFQPSTVVGELVFGRAAFVHAGRATILQRDAITGMVTWDASRPSSTSPSRPFDDPFMMGPLVDPGPWVRAIADRPDAVAAIDSSLDLDGDGLRDVVWSYRNAPGLLAMSGATGSVLWNFHAEPDGQGGPRPTGPATWRASFVPSGQKNTNTLRGMILGLPARFDVDHDGTPDLIATVAFGIPTETMDVSNEAADLDVRLRRIFAVSGKTGRRVWQAPAGDADGGRLDRPAVLVSGKQGATMAFVHGSRWIGLDPSTGSRRGDPFDLGSQPVRPVQYGDLDGDGEPELLALMPAAGGSGRAVSAYSLTSRKLLWTVPMTISLEEENLDPAADWPWLVRLDADGTTAVLVPDDGPMPPGPGYRGVRRIDGRTGRTLWTCPMRPNPGPYDGQTHCLEAPDLDGDGIREVILAWCMPQQINFFHYRDPLAWLYVDALSGKDGHPVWSWHRSASPGGYVGVYAPVWWGRGPDGLPLLAVPADRHDLVAGDSDPFTPSGAPIVHILEASTGRERHVVPGLSVPRAADLDGDGVLDLWGGLDGRVAAFRGTAPEVWRSLGSRSAGSDLDGDGIVDMLPDQLQAGGELRLDPRGDPTAVARSTADGHVLWKSRLGSPRSWFLSGALSYSSLITLRAPAGDLDGDGAVDLVVSSGFEQVMPRSPGGAPMVPLRAISGRTGRVLWSAGPLPTGSRTADNVTIDPTFPPVAVAIEPAGRPDLIVRSFTQRPAPTSGTSAGPMTDERLTRLSGRDGRVIWDIPLISSEPTGPPDLTGRAAASPVADVDGDGSPDMVILGPFADDRGTILVGLRAIALATGRILWTHPLDLDPSAVEQASVRAGDLDQDGRAEVVLVKHGASPSAPITTIATLDGRDGSVRWRWPNGAPEPPPVALDGPIPPPGGPPVPPDGPIPSSRSSYDLAAVATVAKDGRKAVVIGRRSPTSSVLLLLDGRGQEAARRALPGVDDFALITVDLTGDGLDELIVSTWSEMRVFGPDLKPLWTQPASFGSPWENPGLVATAMPGSAGRPGLIIMPDGLVRNGPDGRRLGLGPRASGGVRKQVRYLESRDPRRPLFWIVGDGRESVCYRMMPDTPERDPGALGRPPGPPAADPRWQRPLPWAIPIVEFIGPRGFLTMIVLALVNLAIPLGLLKLAARRRPWSMRLLLALPLAAAVPLYALQFFEPLIEAGIGGTMVATGVIYTVATLAGAPLVA